MTNFERITKSPEILTNFLYYEDDCQTICCGMCQEKKKCDELENFEYDCIKNILNWLNLESEEKKDELIEELKYE